MQIDSAHPLGECRFYMRSVIRQLRSRNHKGEQMENKELKIKVIGIGGAGNNIVNSMNENKLDGVELYVANTDRQVLEKAEVQMEGSQRKKHTQRLRES